MTTFVCGTCGETVEALARQAWHRCQGRMRELQPIDPEPPAVPPAPAPTIQASLF